MLCNLWDFSKSLCNFKECAITLPWKAPYHYETKYVKFWLLNLLKLYFMLFIYFYSKFRSGLIEKIGEIIEKQDPNGTFDLSNRTEPYTDATLVALCERSTSSNLSGARYSYLQLIFHHIIKWIDLPKIFEW